MTVVDNPDWEEGIASSLRAALTALTPMADVDAVAVGLADQPLVGPGAYERARGGRAVRRSRCRTYDGEPGNPVKLARSLWPEAMELRGDVGRARADARSVVVDWIDCTDTGSAADIDTLEDLERLQPGGPVKIEDSFQVDVPVDEAWKVLLDLERIAPCLPGAQLTEVEGDEYRGTVKIKVGPITAQYKGVAKIEEADEANHKVVLQAEGRDTRGQGNASATVTATLVGDGASTTVNIDTDLNITGKVAQFGRGVMADVSSKLLGQFADNLKKDVLSGTPSDERSADRGRSAPAATGPTPATADEGPRRSSPRRPSRST